MTDRQVRSVDMSEFEVRASLREISGVVVPFNTPTRIGNYVETFQRGAFARTIVERGTRVKLLFAHDLARPLGRAVSLVEEQRGLVGTFKVANTAAGNDALELIANGAIDSFSVGFQPVVDDWSQARDRVTRTECKLLETSLVTLPAFETARIESMRSADVYDPNFDPHVIRARLALLFLGATQ